MPKLRDLLRGQDFHLRETSDHFVIRAFRRALGEEIQLENESDNA